MGEAAHVSTTTTDKLDELLQQAGVDMGRPERRRERAVRLTNEGLTEQELQQLVDWAHATRRKVHTVGSWLGWATSSKARWSAMLADMRALQLKRATTEHAAAPNAPVKRAVSDADSAARVRGMAWCRVHGDGADRATVAMELGVSIEQLNELLENERLARLPRHEPRPAALKPPPRLRVVGGPAAPAKEETW